MEFASYLAGERWSDHPACTHPVLAALARDVNDFVGDEHRAQLVELIPDVVGLNDADPIVAATIAVRAAVAALPVAPLEAQHVLCAGALSWDTYLAQSSHPCATRLRAELAGVLELVPAQHDWAIRRRQAVGQVSTDPGHLVRRVAPLMVHTATIGLNQAAIPDGPQRLVELLRAAIGDVRALTPDRWAGSGRSGSELRAGRGRFRPAERVTLG